MIYGHLDDSLFSNFRIYSVQVSMCGQRWENCDICIICDSQCWKVCNSPPSQVRSELHDVTERIAWEPKSHWSHLGWKDKFSSGPSQHVKAIKDGCHFPMHARPQDMQQELVMVPCQSSKKPASHPSRLHSMVTQKKLKIQSRHSRLVGMETLAHLCGIVFFFQKKLHNNRWESTATASITIFLVEAQLLWSKWHYSHP